MCRKDYESDFGHTERKMKNEHEVEYLESGSLKTPTDEGSSLGVRMRRGAEG